MRRDAGAPQSGSLTVRWILNLIRGRRKARPLIARSADSPTARFIMELHVQVVHRAVSSVDHLVDRATCVKSQRVEPAATLVKKVKHRPDSVPERFGLLGCQSRAFHAYAIYTYT
jgi:hypothetical protein